MDIIAVGIFVALVVLTFGLVRLCDVLGEKK
jgi:hypothetical protein